MARYNSRMVAHVWAQGRKDAGQNSNNQFYFVGPVLYSYGSHFVVGVIDDAGVAWLNSDGYSMTTAKHKAFAWQAVSHRKAFSIPDLTGLRYAIQDRHDKTQRQFVRNSIKNYMDKHWQAFPAESEAGAILWRHVSPRGTWKAEHARRQAKHDKANAINAKRAYRHQMILARAVAATPLEMVKLRAIERISQANDYRRDRAASETVSYYRDIHRTPGLSKPLRAALWARVKLAKEVADRLTRYSSRARSEERAALAVIRRIWAGDYGAQGELNYRLAESQQLRTIARLHMPPAMRERGEARLAHVESEIVRLEAEAAAARFAEEKAKREAWYAGEHRTYGLTDERGGALLRATDAELDGCRVIGGTLETSQGATVPLRHAFAVFGFVRDCRAKGLPWLPADAGHDSSHARHGPAHIRVGHFRVDSITAEGDFRAGCHRINWAEVERLARSLGVFDCETVSPDEVEA